MPGNNEDKNDYARCRLLLKRREREAGLVPPVPGELACDYFLPEFDDCPLAVEYRRLSKLLGTPTGDPKPDTDPCDPPDRKRKRKCKDHCQE